jgi:hypothetical protein
MVTNVFLLSTRLHEGIPRVGHMHMYPAEEVPTARRCWCNMKQPCHQHVVVTYRGFWSCNSVDKESISFVVDNHESRKPDSQSPSSMMTRSEKFDRSDNIIYHDGKVQSLPRTDHVTGGSERHKGRVSAKPVDDLPASGSGPSKSEMVQGGSRTRRDCGAAGIHRNLVPV